MCICDLRLLAGEEAYIRICERTYIRRVWTPYIRMFQISNRRPVELALELHRDAGIYDKGPKTASTKQFECRHDFLQH